MEGSVRKHTHRSLTFIVYLGRKKYPPNGTPSKPQWQEIIQDDSKIEYQAMSEDEPGEAEIQDDEPEEILVETMDENSLSYEDDMLFTAKK